MEKSMINDNTKNFFRNLIVHIEGCFGEAVMFDKIVYDSSKEMIFLHFNIFGDLWRFEAGHHKTEGIVISFSENFYSSSKKTKPSTEFIYDGFYFDYDMEKIISFIYNYYFSE